MSRIRVAYGLTLNIGNYESVRLDASLERDITPDEDKREAYKDAWHRVYMEVKLQEKAARKKYLGT